MIARIKNLTVRRVVIAVAYLPLLTLHVALAVAAAAAEITEDAYRVWKAPEA